MLSNFNGVKDVEKRVKIIVTIGPSTCDEESLRKIKDKGVDFVRVNMSHSSVDYLKNAIRLAKKVDIPFVIDTEGSQIRTGELNQNSIVFEEGEEIKIYGKEIVGNQREICLKPGHVISQLEGGDIIHVDFDTLILNVTDTSTAKEGYITAKIIAGGTLGRNKAVIIDPASKKRFNLPALSEKDYQSIAIGLEEGIGHIAASFMRSGKSVDEVRSATQNTMKIISKIECIDALENLNEIIEKSDYLLIDRGDLSKEIPIEKIPFTQKIILHKAKQQGVGVFVATNLLETMVERRKPTRAEVHDVINTIIDGASGLALAAETAIGKYPMGCINMLNKLIKHTQETVTPEQIQRKEDQFVKLLEEKNYLLDMQVASSLVTPHGGKLIDRMVHQPPQQYLDALPKIKISQTAQMDAEQIAIGTFSPLEGFMGKEDTQSVLDKMKLKNGLVWPLPIVLDVSEEEAATVNPGQEVVLVDEHDQAMAILHLEEKYFVDKKEMARKMYGTESEEHPGVRMVKSMKPIFLAGKIDLLKRRNAEHREYELTPKQVRRLFEERGWSKVVGFHTRNVIHRSHEFIQLEALRQENCDGLFIHPIVGKKKAGDFQPKYIIKSYESMLKQFYPKDSALFAAFSSYSRYAGPREALFTALCRKNFGCSHFIVGRDHTGVGDFYHPKASHNIFDRFPDLGIIPIRFDTIFYSEKQGKHLHEQEHPQHPAEDKLLISGTQARKMFEAQQVPPEWFMRPEISQMIVDAVKRGEEVFVRGE